MTTKGWLFCMTIFALAFFLGAHHNALDSILFAISYWISPVVTYPCPPPAP